MKFLSPILNQKRELPNCTSYKEMNFSNEIFKCILQRKSILTYKQNAIYSLNWRNEIFLIH